jgi:hypothetical protein
MLHVKKVRTAPSTVLVGVFSTGFKTDILLSQLFLYFKEFGTVYFVLVIIFFGGSL